MEGSKRLGDIYTYVLSTPSLSLKTDSLCPIPEHGRFNCASLCVRMCVSLSVSLFFSAPSSRTLLVLPSTLPAAE